MLAGGVGFEFEPARWITIENTIREALNNLDIETARRRALDLSSREELAEICSNYVALRQVELDPPLASDALAQVNAVENAASALQAALQVLLDADGVAYRVQRLFGFALREVQTQDLRHGIKRRLVFLDDMAGDAEVLTRAAIRSAS